MSDSRYIDFISAYCDNWCERCAFTDRCSAFAARCAMAMCDDPADALELAVGRAPRGDGEEEQPAAREWLDDFDNSPPTPQEMEDFRREEAQRDERIGSTAIARTARLYTMLAYRWLRAKDESLRDRAASVVALASAADLDSAARASDARQVLEALDIATHDHVLIMVKLHRALHARDERACGELADEHPVQNDANGSAKLALLCIGRSEAAWRLLAQWADDELAAVLADQLLQLHAEVDAGFPHACGFVRPGFDEAPDVSAD